MKDLIKITNENGKQLLSAKELHGFLEVGRDFSTWIKERIKKYEFEENIDFAVEITTPQNGGVAKDYIITIEMAKELSMVENNSKGQEARKYFISCEKKLKEVAKPQTIEDLIIMQAQSIKNLKQQVSEANSNALKANEKAEETKQEVQAIREVVTMTSTQWRKDTASLINKIAVKIGGFEHIKPIREESYKILDEKLGVSLKSRLLNKQKKMALEGVPKYKIDKINHLDVIGDDKKLINGYVNIIKELAIKYGVA